MDAFKNLSRNGRKVLSLMQDGRPRTTKEIIIHSGVTDGSREVRRLQEKGYCFLSEWKTTEEGTRYKIWKYKKNE